MKFALKIALFTLLINNSACSQPSEKQLMGGWVLKEVYEVTDIIIFRSDHKYFVYNPNSVDVGSLGKTDDLKSDDIIIDGSYTSMTEKGTWSYEPSTKELILKERDILEEWTDFSDAYGKSSKLRFYVKQLLENKMVLCFDKQGEQACFTYEKNWPYTKNGIEINYKDFAEEYTGTGSQTKEILLSGYETELKLSYEFYKEADQLTITDKTSKELFATEMTATNGRRTKEIPMRGVTKLVLKVTSSEASSKWKIKVEIK